MKDETSDLKKILKEVFARMKSTPAVEPAEVLAKRATSYFIDEWYRIKGAATFFVFRRSVEETNLQFAELLALLRTLITRRSSTKNQKTIQGLHFVKTKDFKSFFQSTLQDVVLAHNENGESMDAAGDFFHDQYLNILRHTILVDCFSGSSSVCVPPYLHLDIQELCGLSGYIHSAGEVVIIRDVNRLTKAELIDAIEKHIDRSQITSERIGLSLFSKEEYRSATGAQQDDLSLGLEMLKIRASKCFVGGERIGPVVAAVVSANKRLVQLFKPDLETSAGHPDNMHDESMLWILSDCGVDAEGKRDINKSYYICYRQSIRNGSPTISFDESKPAWKAPETIPHSLTAAALNLASESLLDDDDNTICDPFVGTGTTLIESVKFLKRKILCSDASEVSRQLTLDNLEFFCQDLDGLNDLKKSFEELAKIFTDIRKKIVDAKSHRPESKRSKERDPYFDEFQKHCSKGSCAAITLFKEIVRNNIQNIKRSDAEPSGILDFDSYSDKLSAIVSLRDRITFYILLKSYFRNPSIPDGNLTSSFVATAEGELGETVERIGRLSAILGDMSRAEEQEEGISPIDGTNLVTFRGILWRWVRVSQSAMKDALAHLLDKDSLRVRVDTRELKGRDDLPQAKVFFGDPPYGLNVTKGGKNLAMLYRTLSTALVSQTSGRGWAILCLPAKTFTGARLSFFTNPALFVGQILCDAASDGRSFFNHASRVPDPNTLFRPPYYWRASRTLDRSIVAFRFFHSGSPIAASDQAGPPSLS